MSAFDWQRMLLDDKTWGFLGEVALRTLLAYLVVFVFLKIAGRRGVRQLSLFELVVILTLGSAAGDVTFYDDVPLLPVLMVFLAMTLLYRGTTWLTDKVPRFGAWLEGQPIVIIRDGCFDFETLERENISHAEFLMELRINGVEHLGQVRLGILEVNADVSLYFYDRQQTRPGLSILPRDHRVRAPHADGHGVYACEHCGQLANLADGQTLKCPRCHHHLWSRALDTCRAD